MKRLVKIAIISAVILVFTTTAFGAGMAVGGTMLPVGPSPVKASVEPPQFQVFWQAWGLVHQHFVDQEMLDPTELTYGAIRGMLDALGDDGHTAFLSPEDVERHQTDVSGKFTGIGARIGVKDRLPVIVAPFDQSPADQAGVKAGDIILEVDGEDVTMLLLNDIVDRIRGEEGTEVVLTVLRPDEEKSLEIPIVRGEIDVPAASWAMIPGTDVALLRFREFTANAERDVVISLKEAEAAGATSLILDVRNNPGGLLEQAIRVPSHFLKNGNVLLQEDGQGKQETFPVIPGGIATDIPLVVLINEGSASSAEILAGAIQDHERGLLVGETTFGTGTVLEPYRLADGSGLMLGTSQWLTPDGRYIRKQGIEPDFVVELPIEADLLGPDELEEITASELPENEDTQLLKALEILGALPEGSAATAEAESE